MAKPHQSSFRRILLSRLLLLSIPVLVTGQIVAYQKAHSGLLETARYNLVESAVQKGVALRNQVAAWRSHLATATMTSAIQSGSAAKTQIFLDQWVAASDQELQCAQVLDWQTGQLIASTCGSHPIFARSPWASSGPFDQQRPLLENVQMVVLAPGQRSPLKAAEPQLAVVMSAPVYVGEDTPTAPGQLRYVLSVQTALQKTEVAPPDIAGYTIVIDQDGTILAHPDADCVGQQVQQKPDGEKLRAIVDLAVSDQPKPDSQFSFEENGVEWTSGASVINVPNGKSVGRTWVVLAAIPLDTALSGLSGVTQVLLILTVGLLAAILLATLYLAKDLAFPIEQLSDYALRLHQRRATDRIPKNFKVKELNYLAEALDSMVTRLEDRAEELETAWQEAQVANQLKSEFLATTSHELRTPLNAIVGCVRLVHDGCCDDRQEELEFLKQADDAALHLLKIINDLLDIAKIEAGKVELNLQPIGIPELCRQCLKMVQPGAQMKRITLSLQLDEQIEYIALDERRVRQMVINLLSNAVKFTPEAGEVTLTARLGYGYQLEQDTRPDLSPVNPHTPYLCLEVADSGIGIPQDRWHLLFRPFQQIDSSLTRKHEGTGLGLALTKRLAELHGGTLSFRSVAGQGSTFRIWLPALAVKATEAGAIATPSPTTPPVTVPGTLQPAAGDHAPTVLSSLQVD
jgi:signal transduction histidine kinase